MPASRLNYLIYYINESQVYGTASKEIALETPPPSGLSLDDKRVGFITFQPDNQMLSFHPLPLETVREATLKHVKKKDIDD